MSDAKTLTAALAPLARTISTLDLADPDACMRALDAAHPLSSLGEVETLCKAAQAEGWLTPKRAGPDLTFGRLAKASPDLFDLSIDVVDMGGAGAEHVHPNGEVSLCFVQEGSPKFCGHPAGWVVVPPGSRHVPTVTDGRMLIAYFLPKGAMTWV